MSAENKKVPIQSPVEQVLRNFYLKVKENDRLMDIHFNILKSGLKKLIQEKCVNIFHSLKAKNMIKEVENPDELFSFQFSNVQEDDETAKKFIECVNGITKTQQEFIESMSIRQEAFEKQFIELKSTCSNKGPDLLDCIHNGTNELLIIHDNLKKDYSNGINNFKF
jgi:hypothetical protein